MFLEIPQNSQENTCARVFFNKVAGLSPKAWNFIKTETLAQVFSCEFCEISKNPFFYRTPLVAASDLWWSIFVNIVNGLQFPQNHDPMITKFEQNNYLNQIITNRYHTS